MVTNMDVNSISQRSLRNGIGLWMMCRDSRTELTSPLGSSRLVQIIPTTTADMTTGV